MCLAIPAEIIEVLKDHQAVINIGGVYRQISTVLVGDVSVGEYVIVHVGFAISKLDQIDAEKTLAMFDQMAENLEE